MDPLQLGFYKGMGGNYGAVQFNLQRPHYYVKGNTKLKNFEGRFIPETWKKTNENLTKEDLTSREGALFLEITSATGKNEYDWSRKIVIALSIHDMGKLLLVLEGTKPSIDIFHDPGAKTATEGKVNKKLSVSSPQGIAAGVMIVASQTEAGGEKRIHTVPLSGDEVKTLAACIRGALPVALAWD
jgi:hypothetical protein